MKLSSIQRRLGALFAGFALLIAVTAAGTFLGLNAQSQDGQLINLAGRQRMLAQQMARLSLQLHATDTPQDRAELEVTLQTFDATLAALQQGGQAPYWDRQTVSLVPVNDETARSLLDEVAATWAALRPQLIQIQSLPATDPAFVTAQQSVAEGIPALVRRSDRVVRRYETLAAEKVTRLRRIQAGFLIAAVLLFGLSIWVIRRSILGPVQQLKYAAGRISAGDLGTPVHVQGADEMVLVGETVETMRQQIKHSQERLRQWASELEAHVAQRTHELEALNAVSQEISANLELGQVLQSVTQKTNALLKGDAAFLCLLDQPGASLRLHAASGADQAVVRSVTPVADGFASRVIHADGALRCDAGGCQGECQIMAARYRASHMAAPLHSGNKLIGALCVGSRQPNAFNPETENLLSRLANAAALALNNAHLYAQTDRAAALEERQRMAAEIHDGLTQTILSLRMMNERLQRQLASGQVVESQQTLQRMDQAIHQAEREARSAIDSLQETFSNASILQEQLANLAELAACEGIPVDWIDEISTPFIRPRQETEQVLRVVKEALGNAQRHSRAPYITLKLRQEHHHGVIVVEDHGIGFDLQAGPPEDGRQHFGLKIMQARAARLHGRLEVDAQPGKGTRVSLTWPLAETNGEAR